MASLSGAKEALPGAQEAPVHLKSIADLHSHGIETDGMGLEGKNINLKTTLSQIQALKTDLEKTVNKSSILKDFLKLEQHVASRESVIAVGKLKEAVGRETVSEGAEVDDEEKLLATAEKTIESGNSGTEVLVGSGGEDTLKHTAQTSAESILKNTRSKIEKLGKGRGIIGLLLFDFIVDSENSEGEKNFMDKLFVGGAKYILGWLGLGSVLDDYQTSITDLDTAKKKVESVAATAVELGGETVRENKDAIESVAFTAGAQLVIKLSEKSSTATYDVFSQKVIQDMRFSDLIQKKGNDIQQSTIANVGDIDTAITVLKDQEKTIEGILGKKNPDWRSLSIREIFGSLKTYSDLFSTLDDVDFSDLSQGFNFGNVSFVNGQPVGGSLGTLFEEAKSNAGSKLKGVSTPLFIDILALKTKANTSEFASILSGNTYEKKEDLEFEKDFSAFSLSIFDSIKTDFYLGDEVHRNEFENYLNTRGITPKEALELYIITGGERDPKSYSDTTRTLIYLKVWGMLGEEGGFNSIRANTYNSAIGDAIQETGSEASKKVPPQVKLVLRNVGISALDKAKDSLGTAVGLASEVILEVWRKLSTEEKIAASVAGGVAILVLARSRLFLARAAGIGTGMKLSLLAFLGFTATKAFADTGLRAKHGWKTEEEARLAIIADFEKTRNLDLSVSKETKQSPQEPVIVPARPKGAKLDSSNEKKLEVTEQKIGALTVKINNSTKKVSFLFNGEQKDTYFKTSLENLSDTILEKSSFIEKGGEVFLRVIVAGENKDISLTKLEAKMKEGAKGEYVVAEDLYLYWDLYIEGANS